MKFWQVISWCETEHIVEVAKQAEHLGFEGLILAEHIYYPKQTGSYYYYSADGVSPQTEAMEFADPLISFAAAASVTTSLKFMTGIYVLPLRHPIEAAKNMATLARLSQNRFRLGVGAGWLKEEFDQLSVDFSRRGERMDEMIAVMQGLWRGEPVTHQGKHFTLQDIRIRPYPDKPVPVLAGGHSKAALRRAVESCDGWYGPGNTIDELRSIVPDLIQSRQQAGRSIDGFEIIAPVTEPLNKDDCHELEAMGVSGTVSYPFLFGIGPNTTLEQKQSYMEAFANQFIR